MAAEDGEASDRLLIEALALAPNVAADRRQRCAQARSLGWRASTATDRRRSSRRFAACVLLLRGGSWSRPTGRPVPITSFRQAVRRGVAYLARDRRANGIFPSLSILDNFGLVSMGTRPPLRPDRPAQAEGAIRDLSAPVVDRRAFARPRHHDALGRQSAEGAACALARSRAARAAAQRSDARRRPAHPRDAL